MTVMRRESLQGQTRKKVPGKDNKIKKIPKIHIFRTSRQADRLV